VWQYQPFLRHWSLHSLAVNANVVKHTGPPFAFVGNQKPRVAKRFFRTFSEQILDGRIYRNFRRGRRYVRTSPSNPEWMVEKTELHGPRHFRLGEPHDMCRFNETCVQRTSAVELSL
jgi:hypothetical protein